MSQRDVRPVDMERCIETLSERMGETFEWLQRCEGGFCVRKDGGDEYRQVRFDAIEQDGFKCAKSCFYAGDQQWEAGQVVSLLFKGKGVKWTRAEAHAIRDTIAEELHLGPVQEEWEYVRLKGVRAID